MTPYNLAHRSEGTFWLDLEGRDYQTTWRHIPEFSNNHHTHYRRSIKISLSQRSHTFSRISDCSVYLSLFFLLLPLWSTGRPWNALFHFSFLILRQSIGLLGWVSSPSQDRYLTHTHRINTHRHPCLEWDSNPRSQWSSGRRQFMT
jgi:hypothetical protein